MNSIIHEDCMVFMNSLSNKSIDHIITDIPYDVINRESNGIRNFDKDKADLLDFNLTDFVNQISRVTKNKILIFCSTEQITPLTNALENNNFKTDIAMWRKTNPSPVNGQYIWLSGVECCVVASREYLSDDLKDVIWTTSNGKSKNHPTEKPLKLMELIINNHTEKGDLIYDPCAGSGSTLVAADNLDRNWIGTEKFKSYYDYTVKRIKLNSNG